MVVMYCNILCCRVYVCAAFTPIHPSIHPAWESPICTPRVLTYSAPDNPACYTYCITVYLLYVLSVYGGVRRVRRVRKEIRTPSPQITPSRPSISQEHVRPISDPIIFLSPPPHQLPHWGCLGVTHPPHPCSPTVIVTEMTLIHAKRR